MRSCFITRLRLQKKNEDERHEYIHDVLQVCFEKLYGLNKKIFNGMSEDDMQSLLSRNYKDSFKAHAWDLYREDIEVIKRQRVELANSPIRDPPNTPRQSAEKPPRTRSGTRSASIAKSSPRTTVKRLLAALPPFKINKE